MAKKKKEVNEIPQPKKKKKKQSFKILKEFQTAEIKKQSFKVLKRFETSEKIYEVGDTFLHNDKRVINFLRTNKII